MNKQQLRTHTHWASQVNNAEAYSEPVSVHPNMEFVDINNQGLLQYPGGAARPLNRLKKNRGRLFSGGNTPTRQSKRPMISKEEFMRRYDPSVINGDYLGRSGSPANYMVRSGSVGDLRRNSSSNSGRSYSNSITPRGYNTVRRVGSVPVGFPSNMAGSTLNFSTINEGVSNSIGDSISMNGVSNEKVNSGGASGVVIINGCSKNNGDSPEDVPNLEISPPNDNINGDSNIQDLYQTPVGLGNSNSGSSRNDSLTLSEQNNETQADINTVDKNKNNKDQNTKKQNIFKRFLRALKGK